MTSLTDDVTNWWHHTYRLKVWEHEVALQQWPLEAVWLQLACCRQHPLSSFLSWNNSFSHVIIKYFHFIVDEIYFSSLSNPLQIFPFSRSPNQSLRPPPTPPLINGYFNNSTLYKLCIIIKLLLISLHFWITSYKVPLSGHTIEQNCRN